MGSLRVTAESQAQGVLRYVDAIQAVTPIGDTPISDSLEQAARDRVPGDVNSIVLVSDGEETCGSIPCALGEALKASEPEDVVVESGQVTAVR